MTTYVEKVQTFDVSRFVLFLDLDVSMRELDDVCV